MKNKLKKFLVVLSTVVLVSCASVKKNIIYTVYPVGYILQRLGSSFLTIDSIQTDEIVQRAQLKENYKDLLASSSLFLHIGQLEPYISVNSSEISENMSEKIDLSSLNAIYLFQRYTPVINDGEVTFLEGPYYRDLDMELIDTNKNDLNLWLDPIAMLSMAKDIKEWLIKKYPENISLIEANYTQLETDLVRLDAEYQNLSTKNIKSGKEIKFVSMTASFGNWQKTYGIKVYPIILSKFGSLPSESQLEIIKQRIINDKVNFIVYEPNMTEDMVEVFNELESSLKLKRVELSNLSSLTSSQENSGKDYLSIMYENLSVLETMSTEISQEIQAIEVSENSPKTD